MRPRVSVFLALSIDGFIAAEDGGVAWLSEFGDPEDDFGYGDFFRTVDCLVMGRATWDVVMGFPEWPYGKKRVLVRTHRELPARHGEQAVQGPLGPLLERLTFDGVRHVYLDGGVTVRDGLREGVVDEVTLTTVPVVLGRGIPLFGPDLPPARWHLVSNRSGPHGMVQATWEIRSAD